jgi:hypothetical protein
LITCTDCETCPNGGIRAGCTGTSPGTCLDNPNGEPFDWVVVLYSSIFAIGPLLVGCCMCIFCWRAKHGVADPAPARGYGTLWGVPVPLGGWTSGPSYEEVLQKDYDPRFVYNKRV